ncbi:MAG: hypothetical protein DWQ36_20185 [Acidobacteria bacterium]|nr:MAG: hypothetical protein DWQ30_10140 [Acidobacteriota bacterium]REK03188.1 MAG: hypothetical protein DWQ36_20185 [Acidobacteriota bacterium]
MLRRLPQWTAEQTGQRVAQALRRRGVADARYDAEDFAVRGAGTTYFLGNAHLEINSTWPWRRAAVLERLLDLGSSRAATVSLDWAQVRGRIVPSIRDRFFVQSIRYYDELEGREPRPVPHRRLTDRLCVTLAVDLADCVVLIDGERLERWQVAFDEAYEEALRNLEQRTRSGFEPLVAGRVYQSPWQDGNAAARLLLEEPLRQLELRGGPVFVAPSRDRLFVTGTDDDDGLASLLRLIADEAPFRHPLSRIPIVRRWPEFESMTLPARHPLRPLLQRQALRDWGEIYRNQADLLAVLQRRRGDPAVLGDFLLFEPQSPVGAPSSFTTWPIDCECLLPRVERIALVDPRNPPERELLGMVEWSAADRVLGLEASRCDEYPPRHRARAGTASIVEQLLAPRGGPAAAG